MEYLVLVATSAHNSRRGTDKEYSVCIAQLRVTNYLSSGSCISTRGLVLEHAKYEGCAAGIVCAHTDYSRRGL
jgi:hypothetical protein